MSKKYEDACLKGNIKIVQSLIDKVNLSNNNYKGFINACINGHLNIVKLHEGKLDFRFNKCEPFVLSCWYDQLSVAKYLLSVNEKATLNIIKKGHPILGTMPGIRYRKPAYKTFNWLLKEYTPDTDILKSLLLNCSEGGYLKSFKILTENYIKLDKKLSEDVTGLICLTYRFDIIKYLVAEYGKKITWSSAGISRLVGEIPNNTENTRAIVKFLIRNNIIKFNDLIPYIKKYDYDVYDIKHKLQ